MQSWLKYALSFFALVLILSGFIFAFGPASTRAAFRSGETATGQLRADHNTVSPGEPVATESGTTRQAQPQGPQGLVNSPSNVSTGDKSGNPEAVNAH